MSQPKYEFKHPYNAREHPKLQKVSAWAGHYGTGLYWTIIELAIEGEGSVTVKTLEKFAATHNVTVGTMALLLKTFDLFDYKDGAYFPIPLIPD